MTAAAPTLASLLDRLAAITGATSLREDTAIGDLADHGVESLDLLEWLYEIADEHDLDVDESVFAGLGEDATLGSLHARIVALTRA